MVNSSEAKNPDIPGKKEPCRTCGCEMQDKG